MESTKVKNNRKTDIAIVGWSGRFPGAENIDEFWEIIREGRETITFYSKEELLRKGVEESLLNNPAYVKADSLVESADKFDSSFFGYSPREADFMDPQHRMFLEESYSALENAGYDPEKYAGEIGVFAGCSRNNYWLKNLSRHFEVLKSIGELQTIVNNDKDFLTTRISYKLNLTGPSVDIQAACSTSLVAIHFACQSLVTDECDMALAGGVFVKTPRGEGYIYEEGNIDSPSGHCHPFDKDAVGTVFGEGAGVVVLKRLEDAISDRDTIIAVIKSTAINNDGSLKVGYMAPGVSGQANVVSKALEKADIDPSTISYIETHGTGTRLGDPIEIEALTRAFATGSDKLQFCALGSVKANIGHLDAAAGVAGLIKTALVLKNRTLPPLINYKAPNPELDLDKSPFYINRELKQWDRGNLPVRAAVSSFGIGGTNSHAILEEWSMNQSEISPKRFHLLPISAKSDGSLQKIYNNLVSHIGRTADNIADIGYTLQNGRKEFRNRGLLILENNNDGHPVFQKPAYLNGIAKLSDPKTIFMFTGQGSQYINMARDLYLNFESVKIIMDFADSLLKENHGISLLQILFSESEENSEILNQTSFSQPALFVVQFSIAQLLMEFGIIPDGMTGHSIGEITAACISGVFSFEDAINLVARRGRLMQEQVPGAMLSINMSREEVIPLLTQNVEISLNNAPNFCVVSGSFEAVNVFEKKLMEIKPDTRITRLRTSHAFHSKLMEPALKPFLETFQKVGFGSLNIPFISNVTGTWIKHDEATDPDYWASHIRSMVNFRDGISELLKDENSIFIEIGPGNTLSTLISQFTVKNRLTVLSTLRHPRQTDNDVEFFFKSFAGFWFAGGKVNWGAIYSGEERYRVPLPTYPFERAKHWIEPVVKYSYYVQPQDNQVQLNSTDKYDQEDSDAGMKPDIFFHDRPKLDNDCVPATSIPERRIAAIWEEMLGIRNICITDNFFHLGGHSLLASQIINRINEEFGTSITMEKFFNNPTVRGLTEGEEFKENIQSKVSAKPKTDYLTPMALSKSQERLWIINQIDENTPAYNISFTNIFDGELDIKIFRESLELLFDRHKILKSCFKPGENGPIAYVNFSSGITITEADFSETSGIEQDKRIQEYLEQETLTRFKIETGPLYKISLITLGNEKILFHFTIHHLIFDGWSWGIFTRELSDIYNRLISGKKVKPESPVMDYFEYALQEKNEDQNEKLKPVREYWKNKLKGIPGQLNFPADFKRKNISSGEGGRVAINIPAGMTEKIKTFAKKENVTLYMFFLSLFGFILSRYSGDKDLCVGTPTANRRSSALEKLVGLFINSIVLRMQIDEDIRFSDFLKDVKGISLEALSNQDIAFEDLVDLIQPERVMNVNPIFQVMFAWQNAPRPPLNLVGINADRVFQENGVSPLDMTLYAWEENGSITGEIEFSKDIFKRSTIESFKENFLQLLPQVINKPDIMLKDISIISGLEKQRIAEFNNTEVPLPETGLHSLFEQKAEGYSSNIAVRNVATGSYLTYAGLEDRANQLAHYLHRKGFRRGDISGISMNRSESMVVAMLAVLKAGGAYLPLDPVFPDDRLLYMLKDSGAGFLITEEFLTERFSGIELTTIVIDTEEIEIGKESVKTEVIKIDPDSLAYIIYTSGSTGKPKGVKVHHRAVVNFINGMAKTPGLTPEDRLLAITTLSFDISILEIFLPLSVGAMVYIADNTHTADGEVLARIIQENKISVLQATPTTWTILLASGWKGNKNLKALCGGEPLQSGLARDILVKVGSLWNMYGPTETTVWSTLERITDHTSITVGRPIANTQIHILYNNQEQPVGATGELCIGGSGVSKGYHNRAELNAEKFISWEGQLLYRTGDLARFLDNGKIELLGRNDNQIKLRGFRIEPGEIEFQLSGIEGIKEAIVKPEKFGENDIRLVGYLNVSDNFIFDRDRIIKSIENKLPTYMIPGSYMIMKEFPRTLNGKIDRKALLFDNNEQAADTYESEALTNTEESITNIFLNILKLNNIKKDKSFFDIGGNSLLGLRVINKIKEELGITLTFRDLITNPTVKQMGTFIEQKTGNATKSVNLVHLDEAGKLPLTKNQKRLWLISKLQPDVPLYIIEYTYQLKGSLNRDLFMESLRILFRKHRVVSSVFKVSEGEPYCYIQSSDVNISFIDYSALTEGERPGKLTDLINSFSKKAFDLENGPLYRLFLIRTATDEYYFHLSIHHVIFDGWSWSVLVRDLKKIYSSLLNGGPGEAGKNEFEIYDFAEWEKKAHDKEYENKLAEFWKENLKGASTTLNFPYDFSRKEGVFGRGSAETIRFPKEVSEQLRQLSNEEGVSLFTTLLGAYGVQLNKYTGEDDFNVGMPVANRPHSGLENIFGMFVNTVVVRLRFSKELTFRNIVHTVSESALNAIAHQDLPFENVVEIVNPDRTSNANPVFQVAFVWLKNLDMPVDLDGVKSVRIPEKERTTPFDITLYLWENGDIIEGEIEYSADLLAPDTIIRFRDNFLNLINILTEKSEVPVSSLPFITEKEKKQIGEYNNTAKDYPRDKTIAELYEEIAVLFPDKTAVVFKETALTYKQLNERSNQLARTLRDLGVEANTPVGILAEKSSEIIIAMLGILKAGGCYVPIDPDYPESRINYIIADSGCKILLTQDKFWSVSVEGVEKLNLNSDDTFHKVKKNLKCVSNSLSPIYIMYTSGTTGKPKGSVIPQRGVVRMVRNIDYMELTSDDRILMTGAIVFDVSTFEIWGTLLNGATLYIIEKETILNHKALGEELYKNDITILWLTSALFTQIAEAGTEIFGKLKYLLSGGDILSAPHVNKARKQNPGLKFINGYGPTENTTFSTTYLVERDFDFNIPIGKPICNSTTYIFDRYMNYQPIGIIGELYVGGDGVSLGYLNREDLNARSFLEHPYIKGERIYKTGDFARWLPDGNIEFHGRIDNQLKIRGFRVELEEIESVISETEGVVETVVKPVKDGESDKKLVAFLNINDSFNTEIKELERRMRRKLPPYMIPTGFKLMHGFPVTINGKTDKNALVPDTDIKVIREDLDQSSYSSTELTIFNIWSEALKTKDISVTDNFFEIGGNSLMAISVFSKIESAFKADLGLRLFFDSPRIKDLAEIIDIQTHNIIERDRIIIKKRTGLKIIEGDI